MRGQCRQCGAPVGAGESCRYCGTSAPPAVGPATGPALCVCGVLAAGRCFYCDTAVCDQHADRFWSGQLKAVPIADPSERSVWDWAINANWAIVATLEPAARLVTTRSGGGATCTDCRARFADSSVSRWRELPAEDGALTRHVYANRFGLSHFIDEPTHLADAATRWLRTNGIPTSAVVTEYQRDTRSGKDALGVRSTARAWVVDDWSDNRWLVRESDPAIAWTQIHPVLVDGALLPSPQRRRTKGRWEYCYFDFACPPLFWDSRRLSSFLACLGRLVPTQ